MARVLNLLGVELGPEEDLLPPCEGDNPSGYWEPRWMNALNDEVLALVGSDAWSVLWLEDGWQSRSELEPVRARARGLLEDKFHGAPLWGWKDPRTCLTLPFWRELVPNVSYVVCLRSPIEAVASLQRRGEPDRDRWSWGQLWLEYVGRSIRETGGERRCLAFYSDLLSEPTSELARLADFIGVEQPSDSARDELLQAVDSDLRHHRTRPLDVARDDGLPIETRGMYLTLRAVRALDGGGETLSSALEGYAGELWRSHRRNAELMGELVATRADADAAKAESAALRDELDAAKEGALALSQANAEVEAQRDEARSRAARAEQDLVDLRQTRRYRIAQAMVRPLDLARRLGRRG